LWFYFFHRPYSCFRFKEQGVVGLKHLPVGSDFSPQLAEGLTLPVGPVLDLLAQLLEEHPLLLNFLVLGWDGCLKGAEQPRLLGYLSPQSNN
jgi:hypothetical protein